MPKLESLVQTPGGPKQFKAVFLVANGGRKTVRFGTASNYALNDKKTPADRAAYIARHKVREDFNAPMTAGALARWILWGNSRSWRANLTAYKRRFNL